MTPQRHLQALHFRFLIFAVKQNERLVALLASMRCTLRVIHAVFTVVLVPQVVIKVQAFFSRSLDP